VNEEEAERVRAIFALFEEHRSILLTLIEIERRGWRLKSWTRKTGEFREGGAFDLGSLRRLLTNILYTGSIQHHGKPYPGEHSAILAPGTWERAQTLIAHRASVARGRARNKHHALLKIAERIALLRILRGPDGVLVFRNRRSQVSLLCLPERATQGLEGVSRQIAPRTCDRRIGPRADQGSEPRSL
jgi:site-specific DNA recombinase